MTGGSFNDSDLTSSLARLSIVTIPPPPPAPASSDPSYTLQQNLRTLIEDDHNSWTYAIFWKSSVNIQAGDSALSWGDGYYNGSDNAATTNSVAEQEHRRRILHELNSLITEGTESDDAIEQVTDPEWFFLVSMTQNFVNGSGLPGQAMLGKKQIWVAGSHALAASSCERAQQANMLGIQTMVCVPLGNGVIEFGSTEVITSDAEIMDKVLVLCTFN